MMSIPRKKLTYSKRKFVKRNINYFSIFSRDSFLRFYEFRNLFNLFRCDRFGFQPYSKFWVLRTLFFNNYRILYDYFSQNSIINKLILRRSGLFSPFIDLNIKRRIYFDVVSKSKKFSCSIVDNYFTHIVRPFINILSKIIRVPFGIMYDKVELESMELVSALRSSFIKKYESKKLRYRFLIKKYLKKRQKFKSNKRGSLSILLASALSFGKRGRTYFKNRRSILLYLEQSIQEESVLKRDGFRLAQKILCYSKIDNNKGEEK